MSSNTNHRDYSYATPGASDETWHERPRATPNGETRIIRRRELTSMPSAPNDRGDARQDPVSKELQRYNDPWIDVKRTRRQHVDDRPRKARSEYSPSSSSRSRSRSREDRRRRDRTRQARSLSRDTRNARHDSHEFFDRNFDRSGEGLLAAAAGAGIGVMASRHLGGNHYGAGDRDKERWKSVGGAVVGAAAANAAEKKWRGYVKEKEDGKR